ncbi:hypothetical protein SEES3845_009880 [Salmonella enterica subsp. enterica serovar Senftenberg str. ATCC 43845]|nr:hypothetical protein SEES3845_009880 [Salmonella enterica subsp. enterica serovar Senftenberg str. ATCC 43845]
MEEKRRNLFSGDTASPGHELARTYAVNPTTRSHAQFYAKTLAIALLTDASYLKSLEDDIMQNNRLKDSPVDKHVEDEKKKKNAAR